MVSASATVASRRRAQDVVLTWQATARGGAELSVRDLGNAVARTAGLPVDIVWWGDGDTHRPPESEIERGVSWHYIGDAASYAQTVRKVIASEPLSTVVIGNHRTAMTDTARQPHGADLTPAGQLISTGVHSPVPQVG